MVENDDMSRTLPDPQTFHVRRSLSLIVILTVWALYALDGDLFPPHGNSLFYAIALTWLVTLAIGLGTGFLFAAADPALFSLAPWEKNGEIYDRAGIRAFRWVLLRSGFGWINPNFHVRQTRTDCERLRRQTNSAEAVHWLAGAVLVVLALWFLVDGYPMHGYVMLLVRIPFDVYPIMLQRWNRGRVYRVLRRGQGSVTAAC
jgi:Glycosyl-4,4'-diaponeurosporenoate acyltransferase